MSRCKRCGNCCLVFNWDLKLWQDCKHLIRVDDNTTYCDIYEDRIGQDIGYGFICLHPHEWFYNLPNCPYNIKGRPIHPAFAEEYEE